MLMNPLPSMRKACSTVQAQDRQFFPNSILFGTNVPATLLRGNFENTNNAKSANNASIFLAKTSHSGNGSFKKFNNKKFVVCSYCGMKGHIEDKCYKKHGYPSGYKGKGKYGGSANLVHA